MEVDFSGNLKRMLNIRFLAFFQRANGSIEHCGIEIETDFLHLAALRFAQYFPRSPDLQIVHGKIKARAQLFHRLDRFEAFSSLGAKRLFLWYQSVCIGLMV